MGFRKSGKQVAVAGLVGMATAAAYAAKDKPNVLLINIDDLGWSDLGCMGSDYYKTPNIDKMASEGMLFTNGYAAAANCAPSRACLLTGQTTPRHGVYTVLNSDRGSASTRKLIPTKNTLHIEPDNKTLGHLMKSAGYKTCSIGKWHVSNSPLKNGFDINIAGSHAGGPYTGGYHSPYKYPNCVKKEKGEYLTDRLTREAIKFMSETKEQPFFLYLPYFAVHTPIQGKKDKIEKYKKLPKGKGHDNANYAAMVESVDENIGKLMTALDNLKIANNTLVIFTSDNGGVYKLSRQWPLRSGKGSYYEGGIREPLIVRWPGIIKAGSKSDTPVCNIDFFPTLAAVSGAPAMKKVLDGVNILPLLTGERELAERALYWHFPIYLQGGHCESRDPIFRTRPGSAIRLGDWKLHEYFEDGALELYNLKDDLGEKNNLAKKNPELAKKLHDMLKQWRKETNAPVPTELNPAYGNSEPKKSRGRKNNKGKKKDKKK